MNEGLSLINSLMSYTLCIIQSVPVFIRFSFSRVASLRAFCRGRDVTA